MRPVDSIRGVLVVGQTPPPYGGQAVMIQQLLDAEIPSVSFCHVRMSFSEDMDAIGRFQLKKILHLVSVVFRIFIARIRYRPSILYYPPAGPNRVPFYRDAVILILTRWMFKQTVFHFHAGGISTLYSKLNPMEQWLFRLAYFHPAAAIQTSALAPDDGNFLNAEKTVIVENGLPDVYPRFASLAQGRKNLAVPRILFVGALYESKGIRVLMEACRILKDRGADFELECVGRFESASYEAEIKKLIAESGLSECIRFSGVLIGDKKWEAYACADMFCFPSFFESESFGLVNIEAMQFELPVVSTNWRGIPGVVKEGENGFLAEIRNPQQVAEKLAQLIEDPGLRETMGRAGRKIFLERFSSEVWISKMSDVFKFKDENDIISE
jgi:glycosyltransferase involved in cell wall biosynthesis